MSMWNQYVCSNLAFAMTEKGSWRGRDICQKKLWKKRINCQIKLEKWSHQQRPFIVFGLVNEKS